MKCLVKIFVREEEGYIEFDNSTTGSYHLTSKSMSLKEIMISRLLKIYTKSVLKRELGRELFNILSETMNLNKIIDHLCIKHKTEIIKYIEEELPIILGFLSGALIGIILGYIATTIM